MALKTLFQSLSGKERTSQVRKKAEVALAKYLNLNTFVCKNADYFNGFSFS